MDYILRATKTDSNAEGRVKRNLNSWHAADRLQSKAVKIDGMPRACRARKGILIYNGQL